MPCITYIPKRFQGDSETIIRQANSIISEYRTAGFDLTLRQLYYQFVSRDIIPNNEKSYKRLGSIIDDGRLAGMIDWNAIQDRTRTMHQNSHWSSPAEIIRCCADSYRVDMWANQSTRVECWVEKDALVGVLESVCVKWDVPYFACRGYSSQSAMWRSARRALKNQQDHNQDTVILYLGDHDPSGIDMTRDVAARMKLLSHDTPIIVERLALNMDQVRQYNPPPNPAKMTDVRAEGYVEQFGNESWELDALEPKVIAALIEKAIKANMDPKQWAKDHKRQEADRARLIELADEEDGR
jgi:hypothetical protein